MREPYGRVRIIITAVVLFILFVALLFNYFTVPGLVESANATISQVHIYETMTQQSAEKLTEQAATQGVLRESETAQALGVILTAEAAPSATSTATAALPFTPVAAKIVGSQPYLYTVYGGGRQVGRNLLRQGDTLLILGKPKNDSGWYKVRLGSMEGWIRSDQVRPASKINEYELSYLAGILKDGDSLIFEDTFSGEHKWDLGSGKSTIFDKNKYGESFLTISSKSIESATKDEPLSIGTNNLHIITSFERVNYSSDTFVGLSLDLGNSDALTIRVLKDCRVELLKGESVLDIRTTNPGKNNCSSDGTEDYLEVFIFGDGSMSVQINDSDVVLFPSYLAINTSISINNLVLEVGNGEARFSFIVLTSKP
jgi:hypothetical protein